MRVCVNFETEEFPESELSIAEIMRRKRYSFPHVITKLNTTLVNRDQRETVMVTDGDDLEVYHLISGG